MKYNPLDGDRAKIYFDNMVYQKQLKEHFTVLQKIRMAHEQGRLDKANGLKYNNHYISDEKIAYKNGYFSI